MVVGEPSYPKLNLPPCAPNAVWTHMDLLRGTVALLLSREFFTRLSLSRFPLIPGRVRAPHPCLHVAIAKTCGAGLRTRVTTHRLFCSHHAISPQSPSCCHAPVSPRWTLSHIGWAAWYSGIGFAASTLPFL